MSDILLTAHHLTCIRSEQILFENLSFQLHRGEILVIQGKNGSGKSSLLKILTGLTTSEDGEIFFEQQNIRKIKKYFQQHLHYIGHANGLKLGLSVNENLKLIQSLCWQDEGKLIDERLLQLNLLSKSGALVKQLSAGQKRKVALAKLLLIKRPIWILDEPLSTLDIDAQQFFIQMLKQHQATGGVCIFSSHHTITLSNAKFINLSHV